MRTTMRAQNVNAYGSMCAGKKRHTTRRAARGAAAHLHGSGSRLSVYRCPFCDGFHVGNDYARVAKPRRRRAS